MPQTSRAIAITATTGRMAERVAVWVEVVETVPEITEPTPEEKPKSTNMLPAILTLIVLACGGGSFVFKKVQEKKKAQEAAKPDPDADYVDDDEDYGYDPEFEDDDADNSVDEDDNEPV